MAFYDEMAEVVQELLAPDDQGGLGQGAVEIVRLEPGVPDPLQPWVPVVPTEIVATVNHIGNLETDYTEGGTVHVADIAMMIAPPPFAVRPGDVLRIGGQDAGTIVRAVAEGSLDVPLYVMIHANR